MSINIKKIAKNTLMLYFRQILVMLLSLYTIRAALNILGATDYGIYNVIAGMVSIFSFLSSTMATASQRYFSFEIGKKDFIQLNHVFSLNILIYASIAIIVLFLLETVGVWFLNNRLVIPSDRIISARFVYQFSIISFLCSIIIIPYMALIIAHEDMDRYARLSIVDVILRLTNVYLLKIFVFDKLQLYGILMSAVSIINMFIYVIVCKINYKECNFHFYWNKPLFKEIMAYTVWNFFGAISGICKNQGINILLNQFFNPVIVAARSIASTVNAAAINSYQNFVTSINPQIIKSYAAGQKTEMLWLMFHGTKGTFFLIYLLSLPLILEMPKILSLWIGNPPQYAVLFTRLMLVDTFIDSISYSSATVALATGKIKLYRLVTGCIILLNFPLSLLLLHLGLQAHSVMIVAICLSAVTVTVRILILHVLIDFSLLQFLKEVVLPIFVVFVTSAILPIFLYVVLSPSFFRLCVIAIVSVLSICGCMYLFGLDKMEQQRIKNIILRKICIQME